MTWVTGEASSETSSTLNTTSHPGNDIDISSCRSACSVQVSQSNTVISLCVIGSCVPIDQRTSADEEEASVLSFCSENYAQQGGLAQLHASNVGNTTSLQLSQVGPDTAQWLALQQL